MYDYVKPKYHEKENLCLKISFRAYNLMTKSITRSLNIVGIWIEKSIYKIVLIYSKLIFRSTISREHRLLCYMNTECFIVCIKTDDIYKDIAEDLETRFDISNYELESNSIDRPLPKGKNKKIYGLMIDELGGTIMRKFVELKAKTYSYLIGDDREDKKAKDTKKSVVKRKLKFESYKSFS